MDTYRTALELSLKNVEQVFSTYKLVFPVEGSPISVGLELEKALETQTYETLPSYLFKAMTTWGTVDDFKSFLPKLFRMLIFDADHLLWNELLLRKLTYANFLKWDSTEVEAIENFFEKAWHYILAEFKQPKCVQSYEFIREVHNPQPYLDYWDTQLNKSEAVQHLIEWINYDYGIMWTGYKQIGVSPVHNKWILRLDVPERLEAFFFQNMDAEFASSVSNAIENLKWIHQQMDDELAHRLGLKT